MTNSIILVAALFGEISLGEWALSRGYERGETMPERVFVSTDRMVGYVEDLHLHDWSETRHLHLGGNLFVYIPRNAFDAMPLLETLDVSDNPLTHVESGWLGRLPHLTQVDLAWSKVDVFDLSRADLRNFDWLRTWEIRSAAVTGLHLHRSQVADHALERILAATEPYHETMTDLRIEYARGGDFDALVAGLESLTDVWADQEQYDMSALLRAWDAMPGQTVHVVPEPTAFELGIMLLAIVVTAVCWREAQRRDGD